jgi:twinkle protein
MGVVIVKNQPCLDRVGCGSSDARQIYEDRTSFCFSCQQFFPKQQDEEEFIVEPVKEFSKKLSLEDIKDLPIRGFKERDISKEVTEFFGVKVSYNENGEIDTHYYPYGDKAYKIRKLPKIFSWINKSDDLFGRGAFNSGGKRLIITEGEIDALSVAQASMDRYKKIYPVVGMSSAVMTRSLIEHREWIRSFKEVILCLDSDEAGKRATEEAIKVIGIDKVKMVKLPLKDPNAVLVTHGSNKLMQCIFDASAYVPSGIISPDEIWEAIEKRSKIPATPYPECMNSINKKLKGQRLNEITLFISGTGSGKSTLLREIMLNDLATTDDKIGIISLEETPAETGSKLAGMALRRNPADEEIPLEELRVGFESLFSDNRIVLLNHEGNFADGSILDKIEYMCLVGCKYIFIDHITILVSEGVADLTGNEAQDKMMNELSRVVQKHPVWIGLVSHLRKAPSGGRSFEEGKLPSLDDIKGSGSIKQISYDIIAFARNMSAETESERNTVHTSVLKARTTGQTGPCRDLFYIHKTGRMIEAPDDDDFTSVG